MQRVKDARARFALRKCFTRQPRSNWLAAVAAVSRKNYGRLSTAGSQSYGGSSLCMCVGGGGGGGVHRSRALRRQLAANQKPAVSPPEGAQSGCVVCASRACRNCIMTSSLERFFSGHILLGLFCRSDYVSYPV